MRKLILSVAALAAVSGALAGDPEGYKAKMTATFSGYSGTGALTDFPVLLKLPAAQFNRADRQDLVVVDSKGTPLAYEIDSTTDAEVLVWVKIPSLTKETTVTAWFGKDEPDAKDFEAKDVWSGGYAAVWHLNENAVDSTGHNLQQTVRKADHVSAVTDATILGRALKLNANNEAGILLPTPLEGFRDTSISDPEKVTLSGWFKPEKTVPSRAMRLLTWKRDTQYSGIDTFQNTNGKFYMRGKNKSVSWITASSMPWTAGEWAHLVARLDYDNETKTHAYSAFLNGTEMPVDPKQAATSDLELKSGDANLGLCGFGNMGAGYDDKGQIYYGSDYQYPFANGQLDEFRVYNGVASDDWIKAEYETAKDNATFTTYGPLTFNDADAVVDGIWTGAAGNGVWSDPANWEGGKVAKGSTCVVTFASSADAETITLTEDIMVAKLVQTDSCARRIVGARVTFSGPAEVAVAGGTLTVGADFDVSGLVKTGAGTLAVEGAFVCKGDLTVEAGRVGLKGGVASATARGEPGTLLSEPGTLLYDEDRVATYIGVVPPEGGFTEALLGNLKEGTKTVGEVRFSAKCAGFVRDGVHYLRLAAPVELVKDKEYHLTAINGSNVVLANAVTLLTVPTAQAAEVRGKIVLAAGTELDLSAGLVTATGLEGSGAIVATEPTEIDLTLDKDGTFAGSTVGLVGLVKRSTTTLTLTGENVFAGGVTCRDGEVIAATDLTIDPSAPIAFGDPSGRNLTGKFRIAAPEATLKNTVVVQRMTTVGMTTQGIYAPAGQTLTLSGTEIVDYDKNVNVAQASTPQFVLHANAAEAGTDPKIVFANETVSYLDFAARVDGDAARATERPANEIRIVDINAPWRVRKFTVQNNVLNALGGTVTFGGTTKFLADWLDLTGAQVKVVQEPGTQVEAVTDLRLTDSSPSWEEIKESNVDWTIGEGATLFARGFPSVLSNAEKTKNSVLRFDGGTFQLNQSTPDTQKDPETEEVSVVSRELFPAGESLPIEVTAKGGTISLLKPEKTEAIPVSIAAPTRGEGSLKITGAANLPEVTLKADFAHTGATIVKDATLVVEADTIHTLAALVTEGTVKKAGAGTLAIAPNRAAPVASTGTIRVENGALGLQAALDVVEPTLVSDGSFEPVNALPYGNQPQQDKRSQRDAQWLQENLPDWTFDPNDKDGSGITDNGSYFSNNGQLEALGGTSNLHGALLRKTSSVGPGVISRPIVTTVPNTTVIVKFFYTTRWYGAKTWSGRIGVLFDGKEVFASETIRSVTQAEAKTWREGTVEIEVPKAGSHTLAFTALEATNEDGTAVDSEILLDMVKLGTKTPQSGDLSAALGGLTLDIAAGAKLDLSAGIQGVKLGKVIYDGQKVSGTLSAATHPEFVTGTGKAKTGSGLAILIR